MSGGEGEIRRDGEGEIRRGDHRGHQERRGRGNQERWGKGDQERWGWGDGDGEIRRERRRKVEEKALPVFLASAHLHGRER